MKTIIKGEKVLNILRVKQATEKEETIKNGNILNLEYAILMLKLQLSTNKERYDIIPMHKLVAAQ
jgi:hypothetical protein